tara:strand:+ start:3508 stop:3780 length:273 start_codon:yes stop_codon:yes gene_type:complete
MEEMNWDAFPGREESLARKTSIKMWKELLNEHFGDPQLACVVPEELLDADLPKRKRTPPTPTQVQYAWDVSYPELCWDTFWESLELRGMR